MRLLKGEYRLGVEPMSGTSDEAWPHGAPAVGQRAERTRAVSKRDIELFTEISGDRNPIHYDEEAAKQSRFGEIVVQGGITSAILNALVAEDLPGPGTATSRSRSSEPRSCAGMERSCWRGRRSATRWR
jgi:acyl dehydratase